LAAFGHEQPQTLRACHSIVGAEGLADKVPNESATRRDPHDTGIVSGWAYCDVYLSYWRGLKEVSLLDRHRLNPGHWGCGPNFMRRLRASSRPITMATLATPDTAPTSTSLPSSPSAMCVYDSRGLAKSDICGVIAHRALITGSLQSR
jgi:hypothetical protein